MQWHKFSSTKGGDGAMRHTVRNNDKIDGVHDRRNKYLGNHHSSMEAPDVSMVNMDRQKPYSKHLVPLSPNGSVSRQI